MSNPFVLKPEEYKRDLDIFGQYLQQASLYLQKTKNISKETADAFLKTSLGKGGIFEFKDPDCVYAERGENGDRYLVNGKLYKYIKTSINDEDLIAPTFTTYLPHKKKQSVLVDFIDTNVKERSRYKKEKAKYIQEKNEIMAAISHCQQDNKKRNNNSMSGAHVSNSTPLYNKTAHSTLTSNCRCTSGYGNANNEKLLSGNRHYWSPDIVRNNITSIIANSDYEVIGGTMAKHNLYCPSVQDIVDCITYSTNLYWTYLYGISGKITPELQDIIDYVGTLNELERAAFLYTGDLYHLKKHNDSFIRDFITKLSTKCVDGDIENPGKVVSSAADDVKCLAAQICSEEMKGLSFGKIVGTPKEKTLALTILNIHETLNEYSDFIKTFFVTTNVPASLAYFPSSIRRSALMSDTDSTIFTVQDWRYWYQGSYKQTQTAYAVDAAVIFIASQTIIHVLARMSANFGIETSRIHQTAMKNEFKFDAFTPTNVAKHYFALISCQEGEVYEKYKKEIKGVHLKSSNVARKVMKQAEDMMIRVMTAVLNDEKVYARDLFIEIANLEREIMASVKSGAPDFFRRGLTKTPGGYKQGTDSVPYKHYLMWEHIYAPKYNSAPPMPYMTVKVSVDLDSKLKTQEWIDSLKDREFANRVISYLAKTGRKHLGKTIQIPLSNINNFGLPEELYEVAGIRNIVVDNVKVMYLILESLGIFILNKKITRLISDEI